MANNINLSNIGAAAVPMAGPATSNGTQQSGPIQNGAFATPQARMRNIAPPTKYNVESGEVEPTGENWTKGGAPETPALAKVDKPAPAVDRRSAWQSQQAEERAARDARSRNRTAESQTLAKDFLKKGDFAGAAKVLGVSPTELRDLMTNASLTIPTPDKPLTPEQQREADEKAFRDDVKKFREEQEQFRTTTIAQHFIDKEIIPVLADTAKYEFLNARRAAEPGVVEAFIYKFMNDHYQKTFDRTKGTGEKLNPADVAEVMEQQMEQAYVRTIQKLKGIKKVSKYFGREEAAAEEQSQTRQAPSANEVPLSQMTEDDLENPTIVEEANPGPPDPRKHFSKDEPREDRAAPGQMFIRKDANGGRVPFSLLSREEKQAIMRQEDSQRRTR